MLFVLAVAGLEGQARYPLLLAVPMIVARALGFVTSPSAPHHLVPGGLMAATVSANTVLFLALGVVVAVRRVSR